MRDRLPIWQSLPDEPHGGQALLDGYFDSRDTSELDPDDPSLEQLVGHILAAGGSMPGVDDQPYEVFHWGQCFRCLAAGSGFSRGEAE